MGREAAAERFGVNLWRMTVGLLPGSRTDEVRRHLPLMLGAARHIAWDMPGVQFLLLKAAAIAQEAVSAPLSRAGLEVRVAEGPSNDALQAMDAAVVASGTATLETALCGVPMAVVYRTSWPTYVAARLVLRIPHIALVNVIAGEPIVPEFVQHCARPEWIARAIVELLRSEERRAQMQEALQRQVKERLSAPARPGDSEGRAGGAVGRAADVVLEFLAQ